MFEVKNKESGKVFTAYAVSGTSFLTYDRQRGIWLWIPMANCEPVEKLSL